MRRKPIICSDKELYDFLCEQMVVDDACDSTKPMFNRKFYYFSFEEAEKYRSIFQILISPGNEYIFYRDTLYCYFDCLNGDYLLC